MASYNDKIRWWADRRCSGPHLSMEILGRYPVRVQPELEGAVNAMNAALKANGYRDPTGPTGSYNCRMIGGTTKWSLHAYAIAIDIDYGENPYLRGQTIPKGFGTDPRFMLTEAQVDAVEGIRNEWGESLWKWLGWSIGDTMHFEIDVPPDRCEVAMFTHFNIGHEYAEWEPVVWLLFQLAGGRIDPNANSAQVQTHLPWKTNVRLVDVQDFDMIADLTGMADSVRERMKGDGIYRWGKEIAALEQYAWGS